MAGQGSSRAHRGRVVSAGSVDSGFREALPVPLRGRGGSESDNIRAGLDRNGGMEYGRNR